MKVLYILSNDGLDGSFLIWAAFIQEAIKHNVSPFVVCKQKLAETDYFRNLLKIHQIQYRTMLVYESVKHFPPKSMRGKLHWTYKMIRALWPKMQFLHRLISYAKEIKPDIIHTNVGTIHEGDLCIF